jgi:hypothetical protein
VALSIDLGALNTSRAGGRQLDHRNTSRNGADTRGESPG